jgi:hypothetical protein
MGDGSEESNRALEMLLMGMDMVPAVAPVPGLSELASSTHSVD